MTKALKLPIILLISIALCLGCKQDFDTINKNPNANQPITIDPEIQLTYVLNRASSERYDQWRGNLIYCSSWAQQLSGDWDADRYNTTNEDWLSAWWNNSYLRVGKDITDLINKTDPTSNIHHMASIFKVFFFQRLTDMYGDIPYSQANQGADFPRPQFDKQQDIYLQFIRELGTAIDGLNENAVSPTAGDILYGGDVNKWKKFGNSLRLRIAMRISNVDPGLAQELGEAALASGVIDNHNDVAYISFSGSDVDGNNANGVSEVFQDFGITGHQFRYSDELVNFILNNDDPRENILMETYTNDGNVDNSVGEGFHLGRPNGIMTNADDFVFAQPRRDVMVAYDSPAIYLGFAETEFLRAEAILKGWVAGSAQEAYESGVRAAMKQLSLYPNAEPIRNVDIDDYLTENNIEYDEGSAIEQINTQKWVALLLDGFEAYANYRRSGYPTLSPGLTDGESNGEIPRRLRYPLDEKINNTDNYLDAVSRLPSGDVITERMWWDVN